MIALQTIGLLIRGLLHRLGVGHLSHRHEPERDENGYRLDSPICWYCERRHTGSVWCPHCSAPVDPYSPEAATSVFWMQDPRNPQASLPDPDHPLYDSALERRTQAILTWPARERRSPFGMPDLDDRPQG